MTREALVPHDAAATIAAGGIAPLRAKLPADERPSAVTARSYAHPALDGKVVVRLEPDAVAAGTDAEMAAFGFSEPKISTPLGQVRFRTLGFPAWALVHDPKKAKVALDVTEDLRKAKRLVLTKPGHAKEAFEKIAKTLQRSGPQFLPSFWEECGRVVADQASQSMAAQCFERARTAERAHKLKIDPEDSDAVFVEFALLGALAVKSLSAYAKELTKSAGGKEAYRRFRSIVVKRALGGMPPWSGMGKELRALANAAKLDLAVEEPALVEELVEAPGVGKAPIEFWTTYRDAIITVAREKPAFRARLRAIWPEPRGGSDEAKDAFCETWVALLGDAGALSGIPDDGLGAWLSRLIKFAGKTPRVEELLRELAPRLAMQPIAVVCGRGRWSSDLHLDLAELALELGIPLADPPQHDDFTTEFMSCDPVHVAAEPRYGKKLVEAVAGMMGNAEGEKKMRGKIGFVAARRRWIEETIGKLEQKPILAVAEALETLTNRTSAMTFVEFPDLYERLGKVELADALVTTLRGGIADEFTWPVYEEAVKKLGNPIRIGGAFPILTLANASKVLALGAGGVIGEHDLVYQPKDHSLDYTFYLDGQFLVVLEPEKGWQRVGYWSSAPKTHFEMKVNLRTWGGDVPAQWSPPGGGVSLGNKAFRAGDQEISDETHFIADATTMWKPDDGKYHAYDPATNAKGATPPPAFLDWPREGYKLNHSTWMLPAPAGLASSPLGVRDGLIGLRVRTKTVDDDDVAHDSERIDGVRIADDMVPFALVTFPGTETPRAITTVNSDSKRFTGGDGPGVMLWSGEESLAQINEHDWASRGWGEVLLPPAAFWCFLTPRDPDGSQALRAIDHVTARAILDAAIADVRASEEKPRALAATEAKVRDALPVITDAAMIRGVAGIAERVAELAITHADLVAMRSKEQAQPGAEGLSGDGALLHKMAAALIAGRATKIADFDVEPEAWLVHGRALAVLALSPLAEEETRTKAREMVRALAGTALVGDLARYRFLKIEAPDDYEDPNEWNTLAITKIGNSTFAIHVSDDWAIEYTSDGTFRVPAPFTIDKETRLTQGLGAAWAEAYLALPDAPIPWDPEIAVRLSERAGISVPEATLLYTGMPFENRWTKDFLGKKRRELVGLKMGDADAARTTFKELDEDKLQAMIERAVPEGAALLTSPLAPGGFVERLGDMWKAKFGKRAKIPQELVVAAKKDLNFGDDLGELLPAFAGEDDLWFLKPDLRAVCDLDGWGDEKGLTTEKARQLAALVSWLYLMRPIGCTIRENLGDVVGKLRELLGDPRVLFPLASYWPEKDNAKTMTAARAILDSAGGKAITLPADDDWKFIEGHDDGVVQIVQYEDADSIRINAGFHTAKAIGARKRIEQIAKTLSSSTDDDDDDEDGQVEGFDGIAIAALILGDDFAAFAERIAETPVPEGGYEANPLASAPKLVAKVVKEHGISSEAAALYLQTLALSEPTQRNVQLWNGWTPKVYKDAVAELAKKKLVVEGKRERAGRACFLKGGYSKGSGKNLPMEEWKQPFYKVFDRQLPSEPAHLLFARAWKRVEDGDKPS